MQHSLWISYLSEDEPFKVQDKEEQKSYKKDKNKCEMDKNNLNKKKKQKKEAKKPSSEVAAIAAGNNLQFLFAFWLCHLGALCLIKCSTLPMMGEAENS